MKKIILLLFLISFTGYSQLNEGFESGIPTTWTVFDNGIGTTQNWGITTNSANIHSGLQAAQVLRENIGQSNVSEDWLVTPLTTIISNAQLRFFARSNFPGDNGTLYQIRISSPSATNPKDVSKYSILKEYTELELSSQATIYEEKTESLAAYAGTNRYIAFVRVYKQPSSQTGGDSWLLDDVKMVQQCFDPYQLTATNITAQTALLGWTQDNNAPLYDVEYGPAGFAQGTGTLHSDVTNPHTATGLPAKTDCQFYVRAKCTSGTESAWVGPFNFRTNAFGMNCIEPIAFTTLPFQVTDDTANYADLFDTSQGTLCGALPSTTNYLAGNDVFYSYTPTTSGSITITMTPADATSKNSSLFVYDGCTNVGVSCLKGIANPAVTARTVSLSVVAGKTYIIVISSAVLSTPPTQTIGYNLLVQTENCSPKPSALSAVNITSNSADLTWSSTGFSAWQVAVQPLGSAVPSVDGVYTTQNPYTATQLTAGTNYQYWVRSECTIGSGIYGSWAGPYYFNTSVCPIAQTCNYTFRMTDSANNGWDGATMQVRQNGIVVATIGSTYTTGAGPVDIIVPLCDNIPYDLFWDTAGTQSQQCIVSIINKFGQTLYTKAAGAGTVGSVLYSNTTNCSTPLCTIAPTNLSTTSILTTGATLTWTAPATTLWDIYLVPAGSPAPDANSVPTYTNVNANPFPVSNLTVDTTYDFYVRVVCSPSSSDWSSKGTFTTVATCPRPINLNVSTITKTSAILSWDKATVSDTKWDVLLVPSTTMTPPTQVPPANPNFPGMILIPGITTPSPLTVNTLTPATIYFYYVRTVCSAVDSSVWAGPFVFNTIICDDENKCVYQFTMTDAGGNGWDGGTMEVRQNGIVVSTIGPGFSSAGPISVSVPLCAGVPFDLYWKAAGTKPAEIGVQVVNSNEDIVYTKLPGAGNPSEVLFASAGDCAPPTCPKPKDLLAPLATLTATTAQLSWTETGSAKKWEVYVVPSGSPMPDNTTPVTGVEPYYIADINPSYTVTGLLPSKNYTFYVRAICSDTDISKWTLLHPQTFTTRPANDECATAKVVPVNPTKVPTLTETGSTVGGTASFPAPVCKGTADEDVWFSFVATAETHIITLSNVTGLATDLDHVVYSGNDCSSLIQLYCSDPNISAAHNLIPGNTYKIRVYTDIAGALQTATFTIAVTTPEVIINNDCINAIQTPVNNDLPCLVKASGALLGAAPSADATTCVGSADDDVWFSFVANSNTQNISLVNLVGTTTDLNYAVYGGTCGSLTQIYCSPANSLTGLNDTFIEGQTYYVRVWSNSIVPQDVSFDLCIGKIIPPITVSTTQYTPAELIEDILLNTKCASVTNVTASTGVDYGQPNGIGYFNKSLSNFPFKDGIILSSGDALYGPGPNVDSNNKNENKSWLGDSDLDKVVHDAGNKNGTFNASKLEFDFVPISDKISFNFLFASDEYGKFQCVFGDVFAFFLTNTETGVTTNLAVVPNTTDLISVTTIRNQLYNGQCGSKNETYFDKFYGENGLNPLGAPVNYSGTVVPMTASSATIPGVKYHIKMAIADYLDQLLDSAIFLEGGSFNMGTVDLGADFTGPNALCHGSSTTLVSKLDPAQYTFKWTKDGNTIPNETSPNLLVTAPGVYAISAQFGASTCDATDSVTVEYYQEAAPGQPKDLILCDPVATTGIFDLTQNSALILAPYTDSHTVDYFLTQDDANNNVNKIQTPTAFTNTVNPQTIYARINNSFIACFSTTTFKIGVQPVLVGLDSDCDGSNFKLIASPVNGSYNSATANYVWTGPEFTEVPGNPYTIIVTKTGSYTVKVTTADGCIAEQSVELSNINCTIQKGISPNGDGDNDVFLLSNVQKLEIFNRYGTRVYSANNYTNQWHGQTDDGKQLPDGTYFYQIERTNGKKVNGWIYVIH